MKSLSANPTYYDNEFIVNLHSQVPFTVTTAACAGMVRMQPYGYESISVRTHVRQEPFIEYKQSSNFWWDYFPYVLALGVGTGLFELFHLIGWIR